MRVEIQENREIRYLRIGEVVKIYGLSRSFWRRMADCGKVRAVRVNNQRIFERSSCEALLSQGYQPNEGFGFSRVFMAANAQFRRGLQASKK